MKNLLIIFLIFKSVYSFTQAPIIYNWQNSKQGWISGGGYNLTAVHNFMAMKSFNTTPLMRSGNLQANLGLNSSDYNQITMVSKILQVVMPIQKIIYLPSRIKYCFMLLCFYSRYINDQLFHLHH